MYTLGLSGVNAGVAARVGGVDALGSALTNVRGLTNNGTLMWVIGRNTAETALYTVNTSTGVGTIVGTRIGPSAIPAAQAAGLAYGGGRLYAVLAFAVGEWQVYEVDPSDGTTTAVREGATEIVNFGLNVDTYGTVTPGGLTYFDGQLWMVDSAKGGLIRIPVTGADRGRGSEVGDVTTMYMNNMPTGARVSEIEKEVKIIVPAPNDRYRAYRFNRCVSVASAEHSYQKNGLTMVPYEFESLVDPSSTQGHYGIIRDFPTFELADAF